MIILEGFSLPYFSGGKSDKEAFELALRRDRELQKRQLETMFQIRKSIRHERGESRVFPERVSERYVWKTLSLRFVVIHMHNVFHFKFNVKK